MSWFSNSNTDERLARIETKLDAILAHLGLEVVDPTSPSSLSEAVKRKADRGQALEAIKMHREETGASLRDAKIAVDRYRASQ